MAEMVCLAIGLVVGAAAGWVVASARMRAQAATRQAELSAKAASADGTIAELRGQLVKAEGDFGGLRKTLDEERQFKTRAETQLAEANRQMAMLEEARTRLSEVFRALSSEALKSNNQAFLDLARQSFEAVIAEARGDIGKRQQAIDELVKPLSTSLGRYEQQINAMEKSRVEAYARLQENLNTLATTTESLRKALAGSKKVGEWGERMTEDVLRLAGMQEGINYIKQSVEAAETGKPDFTFLLPNDLKVNMDVKFPLDKCLDYLNASDDQQRGARAVQFVSAVRGHLRTVAGRGYIDTAAGTVNYVIVFIPNEQIYGVALRLAPELMDEALKMRVVFCGPLTLYAMLCVIRQAAENANIMKMADEVINLLGTFEKQWQRYKETMDMMGKRLHQALEQYEELRETRTRMLERPLDKIEELRAARGLPAPGDGEPMGNPPDTVT